MLDCCRGGESRQNLEARFLLEKINRLKIIRVKHGHLKGVALLAKGHDIVGARQGFGNHLQHRRINPLLAQINERHPQNVGLQLDQFLGRNHLRINQNVSQLLTGSGGLVFGLLDFGSRRESCIEQERLHLFSLNVHRGANS